jgi:hypothetical protein
MPGPQAGFAPVGFTAAALDAPAVSAAILGAVAVESLAAVVLVVVSVVWLVPQAASRLSAATGAAQRAVALFQEIFIKAKG